MTTDDPRQGLVREKVAQAADILAEQGVDAWLLLARESDVLGDPCLPFLVGTSVTWESAFLLTARGERVALVGTGDVANVEATGAWPEVVGYVEGIAAPLRDLLARHAPRSIAVNYSTSDPMADGLTHGMWLNLTGWLAGTPFAARLVSGEPLVRAARGRKSPEEQRRVRAAVATTVQIWDELTGWLRPGLTERQIAAFLHDACDRRGLVPAWDRRYCPTVTAGPDSPRGHVEPTDIVLEPGHLLAVDFGVVQDEYASDMQRTFYVAREGEDGPPATVRAAFAHLDACIQGGARALRPGVAGWEVDAVARDYYARHGLPAWDFALGHQLGRACHDGGTLLGPRWERYGDLPLGRVEADEVYTLEIGLPVPGFGHVSAEEDLLVRPDGAEFLAPPQRAVTVLRA